MRPPVDVTLPDAPLLYRASAATRKGGVMEFTGERYVPELDEPEISFEHWHRYLWSAPLCAGKRVLDVACGEGYGAALLAETAAQVTGVDADAETIAHARSTYTHDNLDFLCGPAQNLPLPDADAFDVVVSFETIEHLGEEDQRRFLAEVRRVLTSDGVAVFSTPNRAIYTDRSHYHNPFHLKEFYPREFRAVLGRSFAHVRLLGQRMYGASYLWPLDGDGKTLREYQLDYDRGTFTPMCEDHKEAVYVIAICADHAIEDPECSILLDAADRMMSERRTSALRLREQEQTIKELRAKESPCIPESQVASQEAHIAMLSERIGFLTGREAEMRRLLVSVHEQLSMRDVDYRALLADLGKAQADLGKAQADLGTTQAELGKAQEECGRLSSELAAIDGERAEAVRHIAVLERNWHEKNAYIETLERTIRASPLILRVSRRLQRLIHT